MNKTSRVRGIVHSSPIKRNPRAAAVHKTASSLASLAETKTRLLEQSVAVWSVADFPHLALEHIGATIGTVVHGIDMSNASDQEISYLYHLLLERKVIFFRDQHCTEAEHIAFGRRFGKLEIHPFNPQHPDFDEIIPIYSNERYVGGANMWHSDVMWRMDPSLGSILLARKVPALGGDTLFADMVAAYQGLPTELKSKIDGLMAINSGSANGSKEKARQRMQQQGATADELTVFDEKYAHIPIPVHPVVRTHPDTNEQAIYVNRAFTRQIVGMHKTESDKLLEHLWAQASIPEYQCRFSWSPGSVAFWDNRAAQHYASSDYWPERREMDRVTICGEVPYFSKSDAELLTSYAADKALLGQLSGPL
jgi:taurine dioxygenase